MDDFYSQIAATVHELLSEAGIELPKTEIDPVAVAFVEDIAATARKYTDQLPALAQAAEEATAEERYSVKGETTYRGYYHPSPVQELIVTNITRGRLVKKPPASGSYYHYRFDGDGMRLEDSHTEKA